MSSKKLMLTIVAHQPYIRHYEDAEKFDFQNDYLFTSISKTYIPLINLLYKLESEGIEFAFSLVISPVLCSLLTDDLIKEQYVAWLEKRIAFGQKEVLRCAKDEKTLAVAQKTLADLEQNKSDFVDKYGQDIIGQIKMFADKGYVELLGTCGTFCYVPHYSDMTEILNAQVETGIISHKTYFGTAPEGFYIPNLGYAKGFDRILRSYGINYTVIDQASVLFADKIPDNGIFTPVRTHYSLVLFGRENRVLADAGDVYKNVDKDAGFELSSEELGDFVALDQPRVPTLFRYWNKEDCIYDAERAHEKAVESARKFVAEKDAKLSKVLSSVESQELCDVVEIPAGILGHSWEEGMTWFETVLRNPGELELSTFSTMTKNQFSLPRVSPYPCSSNGSGYGEDLLDNSNSYMLVYLRKMCERIVDLAGRFTEESGLKVRLLNLGARELLIAQDSLWAQMIHDDVFADYAKEVFKKCVLNFTAVFDSLGTNTVSTEWLTKLEKEHVIFPWMNYRIFSAKV